MTLDLRWTNIDGIDQANLETERKEQIRNLMSSGGCNESAFNSVDAEVLVDLVSDLIQRC